MKRFIVAFIIAFISIMFCSPVIKAGEQNISEDVISSKTALDKAIDDYEKLIDDYIVIYRRIQSGDAEANKELEAFSSRAAEIAQVFQDDANGMTPEQTKRLQKIAEKMQEVFAEENNDDSDSDSVEDVEDDGYEQSEGEQSIFSAKALDQAISDYEKLVDDYIIIYNRIKSGDTDANKEIESLSSRAAEIAQVLQDNASGMTPEHAERMTKIAEKMQKAFAEDSE